MSVSNLKVYRQFYLIYPQLSEIIPQFLHKHFDLKGQSAIGYFKLIENKHIRIGQSANVQLQHPDNLMAALSVEKLANKLSFTHLVQLLPIQDLIKRTFYESECINGTWSVRELKR